MPLVNGRALGIAYLEWLVSSGTAPANMQDQYAQLLMEGVPLQEYKMLYIVIFLFVLS